MIRKQMKELFDNLPEIDITGKWKVFGESTMRKEIFSSKVNDILALEYQRNLTETWWCKFYDDKNNDKYITTIITKSIGMISAILKINEELQIGPGKGMLTAWTVDWDIPEEYLDRQLNEEDLIKLKLVMEEKYNQVIEIEI